MTTATPSTATHAGGAPGAPADGRPCPRDVIYQLLTHRALDYGTTAAGAPVSLLSKQVKEDLYWGKSARKIVTWPAQGLSDMAAHMLWLVVQEARAKHQHTTVSKLLASAVERGLHLADAHLAMGVARHWAHSPDHDADVEQLVTTVLARATSNPATSTSRCGSTARSATPLKPARPPRPGSPGCARPTPGAHRPTSNSARRRAPTPTATNSPTDRLSADLFESAADRRRQSRVASDEAEHGKSRCSASPRERASRPRRDRVGNASDWRAGILGVMSLTRAFRRGALVASRRRAGRRRPGL
jgi:hypothetical protein